MILGVEVSQYTGESKTRSHCSLVFKWGTGKLDKIQLWASRVLQDDRTKRKGLNKRKGGWKKRQQGYFTAQDLFSQDKKKN